MENGSCERIDLIGQPSSVGEARRFVRRVLISWGLEDSVDVVGLLVSELATNAVLHARTNFAIVIVREQCSIRVEVLDDSVVPPRQRRNSTAAATGRGVALVNQLSTTWGLRHNHAGFAKGVWFTVPQEGVADDTWSGDWLEGL